MSDPTGKVLLSLGYKEQGKKKMSPADIAHMKQEMAHQKTLQKTGFWGGAGAGAIIMAKDSKRFLINLRSKYVEQPNTWGTWGGAIDKGEDPAKAVKREIAEESGYKGKIDTIPLLVFKKESFTFYNFLAIIESEFKPTLDWESQGYKWVDFDEWPKPLHFGLKAVFNDIPSMKTLEDQSKLNRRGFFKKVWNKLTKEEIEKLDKIVEDIEYESN